MTLCHNGDNDICDSARGNGEHGGLSKFGKEVVQEMNRVGMIIDLSHAAETTFWQVLELSTKPVVCSHSSCRALCNHPRNLTDEQIKALATRGGVIQVTMYSGFLCKDHEATIGDFIELMDYSEESFETERSTVGGWTLEMFGAFPEEGESFEYENLTITVLKMDGFRVERVRIKREENTEDDE